MRANLPVVALLAALASSCGGDEGRDPYANPWPCAVRAIETLEDDAVTPLGPTVAELFVPALGEHRTTLVYTDGGTTDFTVRVTLDDAPALLVETKPGSLVHEQLDVSCEGAEVQRRAALEFVSADGRFAESLEAVLRATAPDLLLAEVDLAPEAVRGSDVPPGDDGPWTYRFRSWFVAGATSGTIFLVYDGDPLGGPPRFVDVGEFSGVAGP